MRATLLLILGLGTLPSASAEVYRWIDEDGHVHFGDTRPATAPSERVLIDSRDGQPEHSQAAGGNVAPAVEEPQEGSGWDSVGSAEDSAQTLDPRSCEQAQIDWGILNEGMPVYVTDDGRYRPAWHGDTYDGGRDYVPDSHRDGLIRQAENRMSQTCEDPDNIDAVYETYNSWVESEFCKVAQVKYARASQKRSRTPRGELERIRQEMEEQCRS